MLFIVFFGSFARAGYERFRDIDLAVYMTEVPELMRIGHLVSELQHLTGHKVDVVVLNGLYETNPVLSQEIVGRNKMIPNTRIKSAAQIADLFAAYCVRSINTFEDTAPLRRRMNEAFRKRMKEKKFAQFNQTNLHNA